MGTSATLVGVFAGWFLNELSKAGKIKHYVKFLQISTTSNCEKKESLVIVDLELYNSSELSNIIRNTKITIRAGRKELCSKEPIDLRLENLSGREIKTYHCAIFFPNILIEKSKSKQILNFNRITLDFIDGDEKKYSALLGKYQIAKNEVTPCKPTSTS